jgi:hypothetical protein
MKQKEKWAQDHCDEMIKLWPDPMCTHSEKHGWLAGFDFALAKLIEEKFEFVECHSKDCTGDLHHTVRLESLYAKDVLKLGQDEIK